MICKDCKKDVTRKFTGKMSGQGRRVYFDSTGREWYGLKCPDCRYNQQRLKEFVGKRCECGKPMPKSRYFACTECVPTLAEDPGEWAYH